MAKFSKTNLHNIKSIIREETGVNMGKATVLYNDAVRKYALVTGCLLCLASLSAFAYYKFSGINGDEAAFSSVYLGDGKYEIIITNLSDHELKLQDNVKVMQWSTGEPVDGNPDLIRFDSDTIEPNSTGVIKIDISEGYDVERMRENIGDGDWYYFVLTNNNFAFGQDWMCSFDFERQNPEDALSEHQTFVEQKVENAQEQAPEYERGELAFADWGLPVSVLTVSSCFGEQDDGSYCDHINIVGNEGDAIFAVYDGTISKVGFDAANGNYIILTLENGTTVQYGHLKEIKVSEGDAVSKGSEIATMGKTGMATGVNLSFAVRVNGENINPIR